MMNTSPGAISASNQPTNQPIDPQSFFKELFVAVAAVVVNVVVVVLAANLGKYTGADGWKRLIFF